MIICALVSTIDQNLEHQRDAFTNTGCQRLFEDHAGRVAIGRRGWTQARAVLREGDMLVAWRLDRLGRSFNTSYLA